LFPLDNLWVVKALGHIPDKQLHLS